MPQNRHWSIRLPRCPLDTAASNNSVSDVPVDVIAPFDVVATAANGLRAVVPLYDPVKKKHTHTSQFPFFKNPKLFKRRKQIKQKSVNAPDVVVVDSVVIVIDEFDSKCWLIAFIVFAMDAELLPILLNDIDDGEFWVEAVLEFDVVELFALVLFVPLLAFSLLFPLALLLFRDARLLARADIRLFKSSRNNDFKGDTYTFYFFRPQKKIEFC